MKKLARISFFAIAVGAVAFAQETPRFAFNAGAGFTTPIGSTGTRLDTGYNFDLGAGVNFNSAVGALVQFNYNGMGINRTTLDAIGFPGGDVRMWALTLNPIVHLNGKGPVDVYIIGGGGLYNRTLEFTQPTVVRAVGFDPFFGFYRFPVLTNQVLASYSVNKPGVNGGIGLSFGGYRRAKFYAEARYHRMYLGGDRHTDILPVTFGVRF